MYNTYIPLLTYAHANGKAGSKVIPGLAKSPAEDQQRRQDLHALPAQGPQVLRRHPGQGLRLPRARSNGSSSSTPAAPPSTPTSSAPKSSPKTKSGGIPGIKTDDKTGEIVIDLASPRGTFTNELAMLFVALVPPGTPAKNLTADPPPATGPYEIVKVRAGHAAGTTNATRSGRRPTPS